MSNGWMKQNKYQNKKVIIDGIKFDSQLEAGRYCELKILERAGKIESLELQKPFELIPSFKKNGKTYRSGSYIADFCYFDKEKGKVIVEDTKGFETDLYKWKRKQFEYQYPDLTITEIRR